MDSSDIKLLNDDFRQYGASLFKTPGLDDWYTVSFTPEACLNSYGADFLFSADQCVNLKSLKTALQKKGEQLTEEPERNIRPLLLGLARIVGRHQETRELDETELDLKPEPSETLDLGQGAVDNQSIDVLPRKGGGRRS